MTQNFDAWVIYAVSPGRAPRSTDDPLFAWGWGEAMAVLPPGTSADARGAALAAVAQMTHFADGDRSDALQFAKSDSYLSGLSRDLYFDALHPYLTVVRARNLRAVPAGPGETRGRIEFDHVSIDD